MFALGLVSGVVVTFIGFVVVMAPRHWDWYQQNKELEKKLRHATEERDHYMDMAYPPEWGPVQSHEDRIKPTRRTFDDVDPGPIEHRFDDIMDGGK